MAAVRLVFRSPPYIVLSAVSLLAMLVLLLWSSQVVTFGAGGVQVFVEPPFIAAACVIALLFALLLPMEVYAFRLAASSARQAGGTLLDALLGTASMSCCAPVILPSILSFLGFSGATILSFNLQVERFWLPLATISIVLLAYSLASVTRSLQARCDTITRSTAHNLPFPLPADREM